MINSMVMVGQNQGVAVSGVNETAVAVGWLVYQWLCLLHDMASEDGGASRVITHSLQNSYPYRPKTHTHARGYGYTGVRVQVALGIPQGYPWSSLHFAAT